MSSGRGGTLNGQEKWAYADDEIEIVNSFNYLGIVLSSGGAFIKATNTLSGKALRAMNSLLSITKTTQVPINIMLNLFDTFDLSILNYACEIWGFTNAENIERVHRKFCKWLLNVKMSTNNLSLYGEIGRFPLYIGRHVRIIKYWLHLHQSKSDNCILRTLNHVLRKDADNSNTWSSKVKSLLEKSGFLDVWLFPESVDITKFVKIFHNRLRDIFITEWKQGMGLSSSLDIYREIKSSFELTPYLLLIKNRKFRNAMTKLRLSSHQLNIETGRHRNIERLERKCKICNLGDLEDEYHFTLVCRAYGDLRKQYLPKFYYDKPSVFKFISLLNSTKLKILNNLALYIIKSFELRNTLINERVS